MKTIQDMAREAGWDAHHAKFDTRIEAFAKLVREDERESCAKVCEKHGYDHYCGNVTDKIAETIRAQAITAIKEALAQPDYRAVKTYHEGKPVYVAQPEQPKYRRGDRLICLETEEYCVIHISGTDRQWVKFPDSHIGVYTNEQVAELFELLPKEQPQPEPVGRFAKFTDGIWREVTDGSAGVPLYTTPPQPEQNLSCKSTQARLATAWGYVKAQQEQKRPQNCGTSYCSCIECVMEPTQPQQEPVAWRTFDGESGYEYRAYDLNEQYEQEWEQRNPNHKGWVEPLYAVASPCPTCEALARTVMIDQTSHDAAPPAWVGLTDEEVAYFSYVLDHWTITHIRGIEALLKAKNDR